MSEAAPRLFTIGHSTRTFDAFLALLRRDGIRHLVDVRRYPASRRYPHFDAEALREALVAEGIAYSHVLAFGGRRRADRMSVNVGWRNESFRGYADHTATPEFQDALDALLEAGREAPTAIMCAEAVPWRCHRTLIADAVLARGVTVCHILDASTKPHTLTSFARVRNGRVEYPGGEGEDLFSGTAAG